MCADQILTLKELKKSTCTAVISLEIEEKTASSSKTNHCLLYDASVRYSGHYYFEYM